MTRRLTGVLLLAVVYLLALASWDPLDAVAGVLVGAGALAVSRRLPRALADVPSPPSLPRFLAGAAAVAWDALREITVGTWEVALVVLHLRPLRSPGIVAIPIAERSEGAIAMETLIATLAPGEFLVDVDRERGVMLYHVLDASDPEAVRRRHADYYERHQREVLP